MARSGVYELGHEFAFQTPGRSSKSGHFSASRPAEIDPPDTLEIRFNFRNNPAS